MSIAIKKEQCIGCRKCGNVCPGSLIKFGEDHKAYIKYPEECWGCSSCLKECRHGAIAFYLGADIGGMGSKLIVKVEEDIVHWKIEKSNGEISVIDVNRKDSNKY
jgi:adenosine phosphosulfate reductase beta subunit